MEFKRIATTDGMQDGAIFGDLLFRFSAKGIGKVYDLSAKQTNPEEAATPIARFELDMADHVVPHSNAVSFGSRYYAVGDEFPLLYSNVYNNYAKLDEKRVGECCVYRIERTDDGFKSTLVQIIKIGFTDNREYWRSEGDTVDIRPYGNFVVDRDADRYYGFVMRDLDRKTRYFAFDLPKPTDGELDDMGVRLVTLSLTDVIEYFDTPYHNYIQGACYHGGKIYSVEGFGEKRHPALRVIDLRAKEEVLHIDLFDEGLSDEAEFIDFHREKCIYSDAHGRVFELTI